MKFENKQNLFHSDRNPNSLPGDQLLPGWGPERGPWKVEPILQPAEFIVHADEFIALCAKN